VAERRLHRLLHRAGFDGWVAGAPIRDRSGRIIAAADILFARERVILELDGFETHGGRSAFVADPRRIRALSNAGNRVLPVTWDDLDQQPDQLVAEISAALDSRPS
jgi:very-short-patch-repair endonuclease